MKTDALIMSLWISIVSLWVLNVVFFIYALFDFYKSHTSDNKLIPIAFFWFMLNFYATGMFLASGYSTEQSSTVSTNSSPSFARPASRLEQRTSHKELSLVTYTRQVSQHPLLRLHFLTAEGGCYE